MNLTRARQSSRFFYTAAMTVIVVLSMHNRHAAAGTGLHYLTLAASLGAEAVLGGNLAAPLAYDVIDVNGTIKPCATDADCKADETGPDPQVFCKDSTGDGVPNACYVARNRVLAVKPNLNNSGTSYAYRISLVTGKNESVPLGFATEPFDLTNNQAGPGLFHNSYVDDDPHYMDWTVLKGGVVYIVDCVISPPSREYLVQAIAEGEDVQNESAYSEPLMLPTVATWGDVTGGGNPGDPPNGATSLSDVLSAICGFGAGCSGVPYDWLSMEVGGGNLIINLADAFQAVLGFQTAGGYQGTQPLDCP